MSIIVTGGAGFIGSHFILDWLKQSDETVINVDKLTYAGNLSNLDSLKNDPRYIFCKADINDHAFMINTLEQYQPRAIIHFAAESHVDRSITDPDDFIHTNILGTYHLLKASRDYLATLPSISQQQFRFIHVSTDEVYGSLTEDDSAFTEEHPYKPNSPYSASKAASDHLVRAFYQTYGFPGIITHCSNNYGPHQFPEKLIPLIIDHALKGKALPIYGNGSNIRDWLYVRDHCDAIRCVLEKGKAGEKYLISGKCEKNNIEVVKTICKQLDMLVPRKDGISYQKQITFVKDRPGHDLRYASNSDKIESLLGWRPKHSFSDGIQKTVSWYLNHPEIFEC